MGLDSVASEACALKVDAEGADFRVLRGATRLLKESLQIVDFEFVPQVIQDMGDDPGEMLQLLNNAGFQVWASSTQQTSSPPKDTWGGRMCFGSLFQQIPPSAFQDVAVTQPFGFQLLAIRSADV